MPSPPADKRNDLPTTLSSERAPDQDAGDSPFPRYIKAEANLLRLPLFALQTKGLRNLDGIECRGKVTREHEIYDFTLRASRNAATLYPGPLARKAHLAFLSIATETGLPVENPIVWKWRDLCRRMGTTYSGRAVQHLKAAIKSTAGLLIESHYALWSKPEGRMIRNQEDALHLYERVAFVGSELPGGEIADVNCLWLSSWYLDNINAMFTAPLDYELWRFLDDRSPIASRMYEYLLLNFYSGTPVLKINYEKLASLLPIRPERYRSKAKEKLAQPLKLLEMVGVLHKTEWADSKSGIAQLQLHRGRVLTAPRDRRQLPLSFLEDEVADTIEVKELRNAKPATPEWSLVTDFYRLWADDPNPRPSKKELDQAREIIDRHGARKARECIVRVVKRLKKGWPEAKTFGAVQKYLPDAVRDYEREERRTELQQQEELRRRKEKEEQTRRQAVEVKFCATWKVLWESLPDEKREQIREAALQGSNRHFRSTPFGERLCLLELARRQGAVIPEEVALG